MLGGKVEVPTLNGKTEVKVIIDAEEAHGGPKKKMLDTSVLYYLSVVLRLR